MAIKTEKSIQQDIQLEYNKGNTRLFRNNIGIAEYANGTKVAYGVGGKGGLDLLGPHVIIITPEMVGKPVAVFTAIEVKRDKKSATPEQQRMINFLVDMGAIAGVARSIEDVQNIFDAWLEKMQS